MNLCGHLHDFCAVLSALCVILYGQPDKGGLGYPFPQSPVIDDASDNLESCFIEKRESCKWFSCGHLFFESFPPFLWEGGIKGG